MTLRFLVLKESFNDESQVLEKTGCATVGSFPFSEAPPVYRQAGCTLLFIDSHGKLSFFKRADVSSAAPAQLGAFQEAVD